MSKTYRVQYKRMWAQVIRIEEVDADELLAKIKNEGRIVERTFNDGGEINVITVSGPNGNFAEAECYDTDDVRIGW